MNDVKFKRKIANNKLCAKICFIIFAISALLFYIGIIIEDTKYKIEYAKLMNIGMVIILLCGILFIILYYFFKTKATKYRIQLIINILLNTDYSFTSIPYVETNKAQVLFKESDVITNMFFKKYIQGEIIETPFTWRYLKVMKEYWFFYLCLGTFLLNLINIEVLIVLTIITYMLFIYFKGDYLIIHFENPFSFTGYSKNIRFLRKEIKSLSHKEVVNDTVIYTDNIKGFKSYVSKDFLQIIENISNIRKVEFAFYYNQFHLAIKNKYSILNNSVWIKLDQQLNHYYLLNDNLKQLVQLINNKNRDLMKSEVK
ncbi:hypothetical protein KHQ81_13920 [Mycoplasmatota bacterium]|nr:hypothetical protein KHQ81_13920 [Mycoplasmatota bacterium]